MVFFTPRVPVVHYPSLSVYPDEVSAVIEESVLSRNDAPSVTLLASADAVASPSLWSYDVRFDLYTQDGERVHIPSGKIVVFPDVQMSLSVALNGTGSRPTGSFTASPFVWADTTPPPSPEEGTWWLNTTTGDLKEWVA
ncbi:hypothetical protein [Brevibacterium aurantiacum]|uniref:hypothetical protein n=1 Tax=Brevibacterium aurantiacum TaxID=273384 RepID=UPI003F90E441